MLRRDDVDTDLERGDLDVVLTRTRLRVAPAVHAQLFEEDRVAAVSVGSALARLSSIDWPELADESIVVNTVSGTTQARWPPGHRPTGILPCSNYDEWLHPVATGRGVGAVPRSWTRTGTHPGVAYLPLKNAPPAFVYVAYRPRRISPLVRQFVQHAIAACAANGRHAVDGHQRTPA